MTLQEKVFMIDLIKRNYRRRTTFFVLNMMLAMGGLTLIPSGEIDTIIGIICFLVGMSLIFFTNSPYQENLTPWKNKKNQLKALEEQYEAKADFEELQRCVPLKEYFEI